MRAYHDNRAYSHRYDETYVKEVENNGSSGTTSSHGHDSTGRAVVKIDEVSKNIISSRPGQTACVVWTTESFPVNNTSDADEGLRQVGTTLKNGTVFRVVEFGPASRRETTGPIPSIMPSSCRVRSTWSSRTRSST